MAVPATPPLEIPAQGSRAANTSPAPRSSSSSSSLNDVAILQPTSTVPVGHQVSSEPRASLHPMPSDGQGPSTTVAEEHPPQLSQPSPIRTAATSDDSSTCTNTPTTPSRRHTQQNTQCQQVHVSEDHRNSAPSIASKAWTFFVNKVVPISGFLALVLAFTFGIGTWAGMNYANTYSKKQYNIALFAACHDYEDIHQTPFCQRIIADGMKPGVLVKRDKDMTIDEPASAYGLLHSVSTVGGRLLKALHQPAYRIWVGTTLAGSVGRLCGSALHLILWTFPMSTQTGIEITEASGLEYLVLISWRISLFLGWQVILLGCSRYCLHAFVHRAINFRLRYSSRLSFLDEFLRPLLFYDAGYILLSQALTHWVATLGILVGAYLFWLANLRFALPSYDRLTIITTAAIGCLFISLLPCWTMRLSRIGALCLLSFDMFVLWGEDQCNRIKLATLAGLLFGTCLDLLQPNIVTFLFYRACCQ